MNYTPLANAQGVCECHFSAETENVGVDFSRKSEYKVGPIFTKEWGNLNPDFFLIKCANLVPENSPQTGFLFT